MTAERKRLSRALERERAARMLAYQTRMKRRAARASGRFLRLLAEGDSWFDYPLGRSVVAQLEDLTGLLIANMAHHGDEVKQMLSLAQRREITVRLTQAAQAGAPFDALLFSGGGNDIVGEELCLWLKTYSPGMAAGDVLNTGRVSAVFGIIEAGFQDLIEIRDAVSPATVIFAHSYDFAVPTGKGVCNVGPWLRPSLDFRGVPRAMQWDVVRELLTRFDARLLELERSAVNFVAVRTQATLQPTDQWWANEIHPTDGGFDLIARKFHAALLQRFPSLPYA
jgi:hypothetical protein